MGENQSDNCQLRTNNRRHITAILLTISFTLSFLSDLDCFFVQVDVGFVPNNAFHNTTIFGIGLWTFEDPDDRGRCITPSFARGIGGLTKTDELYMNVWSNGDIFWTISRILGLFGLLLGFVDMIFVWVCLCTTSNDNNNKEMHIDVILLLTTFTLACEGTKFGLFFDSEPCTSDTFWEYLDEDEVSTFHQADTCLLGRGTYMSTVSLTFYLVVIFYQLLMRFPPARKRMETKDTHSYDHNTEEDDNLELPSILAHLGKTVPVKSSKRLLNLGPISKISTINVSDKRRGSTSSGLYWRDWRDWRDNNRRGSTRW